MSKLIKKIEIPNGHKCSNYGCSRSVTWDKVVAYRGRAFCSQECAERFEDMNQSEDYKQLLTVEEY